jgi:hypothetical protein
MNIQIPFSEAWESIPLEFTDNIIVFFDEVLQPAHPLRNYDLFPVEKCWRKEKYLVSEQKQSELLWILDLERKKRIKGKTCYYFKLIKSQEELDAIYQADENWWIQYMKDAGAWEE